MNTHRHGTRIALSLVLVAAIGFARAEGVRPNILFIMSDDHAAHAISAYGGTLMDTPNIDRLVEGGVLFENCFCVNSICAPSRAAILTGKYGHANGVDDNAARFDGSQVTLPKLMRDAGYETALVGKWHLKSEPTGFDYWNVLPGQGAYHDPVMIEQGIRKKLKGYVTDLITDRALAWLKGREDEKPFFLMLHHKAPHANWEPAARHRTLFADRDLPLPPTFNDAGAGRGSQMREHQLRVGPSQWGLHFRKLHGPMPEGLTGQAARDYAYQVYMRNYLRCVKAVDENVGRVLDFLDDAGLADNTVVTYTSDQGFFLGDHGIYDKRFMYEESLRMPLLIRAPGLAAPGSRAGAMVLNIDFASTFLALAGASAPEDMQGRSFASVLGGGTPDGWRTAMYYRFTEKAYGIGPMEGIRTKTHKLIHYLYGDPAWELYHLEKDPRELTNLSANPEQAKLLRNLKRQMEEMRTTYGAGKDPPSPRSTRG